MAYTELKERNRVKYYYRAKSQRIGKKVSKRRIYLGANLSKEALVIKEKEADYSLNSKNTAKREKLLETLIKKIRAVLKRKNIRKAGLFGSYAIGKNRKESDIDILIEPSEGMGFGFAGLQIELSEVLNKKVDLLSYNGLSPHLKEKILSQEVRII